MKNKSPLSKFALALTCTLLLLLFALPAIAQNTIQEIQAVAWNPAGNLLAMGGVDTNSAYTVIKPILAVRRASDMSLLFDLSSTTNGHMGSVLSLGWSPDGKYLVAGDTQNTVIVWNINDVNLPLGSIVARLSNTSQPGTLITSVQWSPNGNWIASIQGRAINIWSKASYTLTDQVRIEGGGTLAWSGDSNWLAVDVVFNPKVFRIAANGTFDHSQDYQLMSVEPPFLNAMGIAWNPNGTQLAVTAPYEKKIYIFDVASRTINRTLTLPTGAAGISWSPDGSRLAYSASPRTVRVFDLNSNRELAVYQTGKRGSAENVSWKPDSSMIAFPQAGTQAAVVTAPVANPAPTATPPSSSCG